MNDDKQVMTADGIPFQEGMTLWQCKWQKVDDDPEQFQRDVAKICPAKLCSPNHVEIATRSYGEVISHRIDRLYSTELSAVLRMIKSIDYDINKLQEVREAWAEWQRILEG